MNFITCRSSGDIPEYVSLGRVCVGRLLRVPSPLIYKSYEL